MENKNSITLNGRVALVTGAASGMGEAVAKRFLELGAKVVGFSLEKDCGIQDENFVYVQGDISKFEDCCKASEMAVSTFGKLDALVNCAGIVHEGSLETTSVDRFEKVMKINAFGTFNICKSAIPYLKQNKSTIVTISSDMGAKPLEERIAYNPSKAAVIMLTKCISLEYAPMVRCNTILPGIIDTPMIQKRLAECDDPKALMDVYNSLYAMKTIGCTDNIVDGVVFLSTDASSWITGIELPICGGPL